MIKNVIIRDASAFGDWPPNIFMNHSAGKIPTSPLTICGGASFVWYTIKSICFVRCPVDADVQLLGNDYENNFFTTRHEEKFQC
jgi:hypothetical protein